MSAAAGKTIDIDPPGHVSFKRAKATGKASRIMSLSMVAAYFDVSRNTVLAWVRDGCPIEREATKKGESHDMDIADVINWRLAVVAGQAVDRVSAAISMPGPAGAAPDGGETAEQADTRFKRSRANISEIEEAEAAGAVVLIDAVETMVRTDYAKVRKGLENLGSELADKTAGITDPAQVKSVADKLVRDSVEHLVFRLPDGSVEDDIDDGA